MLLPVVICKHLGQACQHFSHFLALVKSSLLLTIVTLPDVKFTGPLVERGMTEAVSTHAATMGESMFPCLSCNTTRDELEKLNDS